MKHLQLTYCYIQYCYLQYYFRKACLTNPARVGIDSVLRESPGREDAWRIATVLRSRYRMHRKAANLLRIHDYTMLALKPQCCTPATNGNRSRGLTQLPRT